MFCSPLFSPLARYAVDIFLRNFVLIAAGKKEQAVRHAPSLLAQEGRGRWIIRADMLLLHPQTERENVQFNLTTMLSKLVHLIRGKNIPRTAEGGRVDRAKCVTYARMPSGEKKGEDDRDSFLAVFQVRLGLFLALSPGLSRRRMQKQEEEEEGENL